MTQSTLVPSSSLSASLPEDHKILDTRDTDLALALIKTVAKAGASGYANQFLVDGELWTVTATKGE